MGTGKKWPTSRCLEKKKKKASDEQQSQDVVICSEEEKKKKETNYFSHMMRVFNSAQRKIKIPSNLFFGPKAKKFGVMSSLYCKKGDQSSDT